MTLYAIGVRNAELIRLKISDVDSQRMVLHVQGGKRRQDRDVMLSVVLLEELRAQWRRLRKRSRVLLFPGARLRRSTSVIREQSVLFLASVGIDSVAILCLQVVETSSAHLLQQRQADTPGVVY